MATVVTQTETLNVELNNEYGDNVSTFKLEFPKVNLTRQDVETAFNHFFGAENTSKKYLLKNSRGIVASYVNKIEQVTTTISKTEIE